MPAQRPPRSRQSSFNAFALVAVAILSLGCAWQSGTTRHHIGPTLYRSTAPPEGNAIATQTRHLLWLFEFGKSNGISIGYADRLSAAPAPMEGATAAAAPLPRWSAFPAISFGATPSSWKLSLFYLRGDDLPTPIFLMRRILGLQLLAGVEGRGALVGYQRTTRVRPEGDSLYAFRFDSSDAMNMDFRVWQWQPGETPPTYFVLKEFGQ